MDILKELTAFSNKYGKNADLVLAGGGNTSAKDDEILYVKGSGVSLAEIQPEGFVKMSRKKLAEIFQKTYPAEDQAREAAALADLMDARLPSETAKRPSVETTLHSLFPQRYVLHLHPALVNGLTCGRDGAAIAAELFGDAVLWVGLCKPGYVLAKLCKEKMDEYRRQYQRDVSILLLQNHGIFLAAQTVEELETQLNTVMERLRARLKREPDFSEAPCDAAGETLCARAKALYGADACAVFVNNREVQNFVRDEASAAPLLKPFSPDHIVYCKAHPLFLGSIDELEPKFRQYEQLHGYAPKIILLQGVGCAAVGETQKQAQTAALLFRDAMKIAVYAESFGGYLHMTDELTDFIVNWEVESYRQKQN